MKINNTRISTNFEGSTFTIVGREMQRDGRLFTPGQAAKEAWWALRNHCVEQGINFSHSAEYKENPRIRFMTGSDVDEFYRKNPNNHLLNECNSPEEKTIDAEELLKMLDRLKGLGLIKDSAQVKKGNSGIWTRIKQAIVPSATS